MTRFWHPVSDMHAVQASGELILERGEGCHLWDDAGNRYIDSTGALWYANVGYGRSEIADAAAAQMRTLHAYSHYGDVSSRPTTDLAERISSIAPMEDAAVFFTSGGGESIETVVKLVRRYWSLLDQPDRIVIVSRERAYHGLAGYGTSIVGTDAFKVGVGPVAGGTARVAWDSADALEATIVEVGPERVAAFFCEPIIGAGGVYLPPAGYLEAVREICRRHEVLFVADEVICGYGRVGDWFACGRLGLDPDAVTFAKGITSGYVPLGGVIVGRKIQEPFWGGDAAGVWRHGYTYSGHASAAAAAHANLDIIEREGLVARGLALESEIPVALAPLADHELVGEIRAGFGAVAAIQIEPALLADDPGLTDRVTLRARSHGVLTRTLTGGGLQISPPLVITPAELDEIAAGLRGALDDVAPTRQAQESLPGEVGAGIPVVALPEGRADVCVPRNPTPTADEIGCPEPADRNPVAPAHVGHELRGTLHDGAAERVAPAERSLAGVAGELDPDRVRIAAAGVPGDVVLVHALDRGLGIDAVVRRDLGSRVGEPPCAHLGGIPHARESPSCGSRRRRLPAQSRSCGSGFR